MSTLQLIPAGVHLDEFAPAESFPPTGPDPLDDAEHAARNDSYHSPDAPAEPRMGLADWIDGEASYYRSLGTELGDFLAGRIDELTAEARALSADTPGRFLARREAYHGHGLAADDGPRIQCPVCNSWL